jgi:tetratricopeptide (TPR) repeat protein
MNGMSRNIMKNSFNPNQRRLLLALLFVLMLGCWGARSAWANIKQDEAVSLAADHPLYRLANALYGWDMDQAGLELKRLVSLRDSRIAPELITFFRGQVDFYNGDYRNARREWEKLKNKDLVRQADYGLNAARLAQNFQAVESSHFRMKYQDPRDRLLVSAGLQTLESCYQEVGADLDIYPKNKVQVEIYPTSADFITVSTLTEKEVDATGTIAICKFNRLMLTSPRVTLRGYRWQDTLCHEYTHYLIVLKTGNNAPVWLHEGIARVEEKRWEKKADFRIAPDTASILASAARRHDFVPISKIHPSMAKLTDHYEAGLAFAQVELILTSLIEKQGLVSLRELLTSLRAGQNSSTLLARVFQISKLDDLLGLCKEQIAAKNFQEIPGYIFQKQEHKKKDGQEDREENAVFKEITNQEARDFMNLGELLRKRGRPLAALIEYEKSARIQITPPPFLANKIALAQRDLNNLTAAEQTLKNSLRIYPDYVTTYINLGDILARRQKFKEAVSFLEQAKALNPFHPGVYTLLMEQYQRLGEPDRYHQNEQDLAVLLETKE